MPERVNTKPEGARVEGEPENPRRKRSWAVPVLGAVVALLFIMMLVLWGEIADLEERTQGLPEIVASLNSRLLSLEKNGASVDLTSQNLQLLEHNFDVVIEKVEPKMNGLEVSGFIVNESSLKHSMAKFKIMIAGKSNEFIVNELPPGSRGKFTVLVPDVDPKQPAAQRATISFESSTVGGW